MLKVLIVDDSPAQLHKLKQIVEQGGHKTLTAHNGEQAYQVACDERPQVILMDVVMPDMNGYQATRRLSRNDTTRNIPVILVTTKSGEADKAWGLRQGAADYITKPVDPQQLLTAISAALAA